MPKLVHSMYRYMPCACMQCEAMVLRLWEGHFVYTYAVWGKGAISGALRPGIAGHSVQPRGSALLLHVPNHLTTPVVLLVTQMVNYQYRVKCYWVTAGTTLPPIWASTRSTNTTCNTSWQHFHQASKVHTYFQSKAACVYTHKVSAYNTMPQTPP